MAIYTIVFLSILFLAIILMSASKMEGQYLPMPDGKFWLGLIVIAIDVFIYIGIMIGKYFLR